MKNIKFITLLILISLASFNIHSQEITMKYFLNTAVESDKMFESILIDELKTKYSKAIALPAEDFILSVTGSYEFSDDAETGSVSLSKLFLPSGTILNGSYDITKMSEDASAFSLSFSQPIAKNAFGYTYRVRSDIADYESEIAGHQAVEAYEDYLASTIDLFYTWYSNYAAMQAAETSLSESRKLLENIKNKRKAGIAYKVDVNKTEIQMLEKETTYETIKLAYDKTLNLVKAALGSENDIIPVYPGLYDGKELPAQDSYEETILNSRTAMILEALVNKAGISESMAFNNLLPSAYLNGSMTSAGTGTGLSSPEKDYFIGFSVDIPLLLPGKETAEYEKSKLSNKQQKLRSEYSLLHYKKDLENLYMSISVQRSILEKSVKILSLSKEVYKEENEKYNQARISLNDLISAINTLENARFSSINEEIKMNKLLIEWFRLSDTLVSQAKTP